MCSTGREALQPDAPLSRRSVLGGIVPESMLCVLDHYGADKFAQTFIGNFDNPEVIWRYDMRAHMVEMLNQHVAGFDRRLRDNTHALFDWVPVPGISYEYLEEELWCLAYYLRNLCDEGRFPAWPVNTPSQIRQRTLTRGSDRSTT